MLVQGTCYLGYPAVPHRSHRAWTRESPIRGHSATGSQRGRLRAPELRFGRRRALRRAHRHGRGDRPLPVLEVDGHEAVGRERSLPSAAAGGAPVARGAGVPVLALAEERREVRAARGAWRAVHRAALRLQVGVLLCVEEYVAPRARGGGVPGGQRGGPCSTGAGRRSRGHHGGRRRLGDMRRSDGWLRRRVRAER
ncbi:hypothetical protein PHLGIDRAFT_457732 [Phlebiopsis gigantea 11061_1 CR5-6]|uniref:Uncharacterized protein n=1 Tax=Phlebiopsis gigantea (strain 11061_1 CR5-6) TaxID=745531 RepID=A0A0C3SF78_PHLG1|nr:hypothetical protein PHLGIDRAFT_457732 [Phlebiopsis gigantea 11061_1 CR5-6]